MPTLIVDGQRALLGQSPSTLAELLAVVDAQFARHGRIVTAVRLEGVDEPAFRDPAITSRPVAGLKRIEVDSGTEAELAAQCLAEAGQGLASLAEAVCAVADRFREGGLVESNRDLAAITQGISTALAVTGAASLGLGVDVGGLPTPDGTLSDIAATTGRHLEALIASQETQDWIALADILTYALAPALRRWSRICGAIDLPILRTPLHESSVR
jgi:hypothetical protein